MRKYLIPILLCVILAGCSDAQTYDDVYREGYDEGLRDGAYNYDKLDWRDVADYLKESDGDLLIVDKGDYACLAGHNAGVFAEYPMEDSIWLEYKEDDYFADMYLDFYFDGYNYFSDIDDKGDFDYKAVAMIDTSRISDAIKEVGYDDYHEVALIRWEQGDLYAYNDVEEAVFEDLITAESIGKFANENIKGKYEYYKIEE
ncbi:KTSC domain-containing protein [Butyrivibrio sp. X503]|uniref:KTSC domain-containing protein n=1 Tax=Butyrivibrio sp. X503 TaxID=2364878 RepID=UPI000EA873BB|nr:KTSC domain-containing protein [Butyrivibrio sp. X503]RKM57371.1 KTSC domain-containing protein [Butyrivibrio sp. X503]